MQFGFLTVCDDEPIIAIRSLLNHVVSDSGNAAIWQVYAVAGRAVVVEDPRIGNGSVFSTAFDLVTDLGVMDITVVDTERTDVTDINVVGRPSPVPLKANSESLIAIEPVGALAVRMPFWLL